MAALAADAEEGEVSCLPPVAALAADAEEGASKTEGERISDPSHSDPGLFEPLPSLAVGSCVISIQLRDPNNLNGDVMALDVALCVPDREVLSAARTQCAFDRLCDEGIAEVYQDHDLRRGVSADKFHAWGRFYQRHNVKHRSGELWFCRGCGRGLYVYSKEGAENKPRRIGCPTCSQNRLAPFFVSLLTPIILPAKLRDLFARLQGAQFEKYSA